MSHKNKNSESITKSAGNFHTFESYQPEIDISKRPLQYSGSKVDRINAWLKTHWIPVLVVIALVATGIGGSLAYLFNHLEYDPAAIAVKAKKKEVQKFYSPLTGTEVEESDTLRPVTGVIIENSREARPQSGLKDAGVVFESVAEGGITRLLALYQEAKPASIGPVRSVRPQFASWVAAFDAGLAHVGGSAIPLQKLRSGQIRDLDQFFNAKAYQRVSSRPSPHNVYTSDEKLQALNQAKGYTSSTFTPWKRKITKTPPSPASATSITIPVSTGLFAATYSWDQTTNTYLRSTGGAAHLDREKGQLAPKVAIVLQVPHDVIRESNNYRYPDVIGSDKGWLFQNGAVTEITWSKASDKGQIAFNDAAGASVELEAGQTWITAIRSDKVPSWQ